MHYTRYDEEIVQRYGIELQGWTYEKLMNPSTLSSSLPPLKVLHDALVKGTCKFVKLSQAEREAHEAAYMAKIASGEVELRKRKRRSDAGSKRKPKRARKDGSTNTDNEEDRESDNEIDNAKGAKSQEFIEDSDVWVVISFSIYDLCPYSSSFTPENISFSESYIIFPFTSTLFLLK